MGGEEVAAFIPHPLPPAAPPLKLGAAVTGRLRVAEQALVRLELAGEMVPSLDWFIYAFVRKEAVLTSQIEGTQATLVDLLAFEGSRRERSMRASLQPPTSRRSATTSTRSRTHARSARQTHGGCRSRCAY